MRGRKIFSADAQSCGERGGGGVRLRRRKLTSSRINLAADAQKWFSVQG